MKKNGIILAFLVILFAIICFFNSSFCFNWWNAEKSLFLNSCRDSKSLFPNLGIAHTILLYLGAFYSLFIVLKAFVKFDFAKLFEPCLIFFKRCLNKIKSNFKTYCIWLCWCLFIVCCSIEIFLRCVGWQYNYLELNKSGGYLSPFQVTFERGWFHVFRPNIESIQTKKEFTQTFHTNSLGLFDKEWSISKKKKRIFCIGDSFTQGIGASLDSTYPKILQEILGDSMEVCNAGVAASDPFFGYILLREKLLHFKPDYALVTVNTSDISDVTSRGGFERFLSDGTLQFKKGPWWETFYAHSHIVRFIAQTYGLNGQFMDEKEYAIQTKIAVRKIEDCIDSFSALGERNSIQIYIVFHPLKEELLARKLSYNEILLYCKNKQIPTINVLTEMLNQHMDTTEINNLFWQYDSHYKNRGYKIMAEAISKGIIK